MTLRARLAWPVVAIMVALVIVLLVRAENRRDEQPSPQVSITQS